MIFGFNTDIHGTDGIYHLQTEDRGSRNPVVESIIYVGGKIVGKKRTPYDVATWSKQQVEEAVRVQHKELTESIRRGTWATAVTPAKGDSAHSPIHAGDAGNRRVAIKLTNPQSFFQGEYFRFHLMVDASMGNGANIPLQVRWVVSGAVRDEQSVSTRGDGSAEIWVPAPEIDQSAALILKAGPPERASFAKFSISPAH